MPLHYIPKLIKVFNLYSPVLPARALLSRMRLLGIAVFAVILAVASANTITVTSWCPVSIIGKCPETSCPAPQQVELRYGDVRSELLVVLRRSVMDAIEHQLLIRSHRCPLL